MQPNDPNVPSFDPRRVIERIGVDALADMLASTGYIIQRRILIDLAHTLRSRKPWLIEGPRGGGKTALAEALAKACNLSTFYLQGMDELTLADVLYSWDREAQTQMVRQELAAGIPLKEAQGRQFTREYLILGEALAAFDYASYSGPFRYSLLTKPISSPKRLKTCCCNSWGAGGRMSHASATSAFVTLGSGLS
jgi:AAA domain (dynein-related subfamily)